MGLGGKRKGAGRKKGQATLDKIAAREFVRQKVTRELGPLIDAQVANAKGLKYLIARHKASGKFERIAESDLQRVMAGADSNHVVLEVWDKDPSVQAFTDLMNRALDKPKEQPQDVEVKGDLVVRWQEE